MPAASAPGSPEPVAAPFAPPPAAQPSVAAPTVAVPSAISAASAAVPTAKPPARKIATTRRVRLSVSRVDPWSVMKLSFLLSVALGIAGVVMTGVLWTLVNGLGIFTTIDRLVRENQLAGASPFNIMDYVAFERVLSLAIVLGVINVILLTAMATLGAFLYNISSALVGGLHLTLTDD